MCDREATSIPCPYELVKCLPGVALGLSRAVAVKQHSFSGDRTDACERRERRVEIARR
jgi:hypothetical protein